MLKGVVAGIGENDRVLLWPGGIWNWFDPLTVIDAVAELARRRDDVRLFFLGLRHPNPTRARDGGGAAGRRTRGGSSACATAPCSSTRSWVPYEERGAYLLEADLGVSAHFDDLESRFAFRTRLLDCFWAGLPVVTTRGDSLGDLVERRGLGATVAGARRRRLGRALETLLDDAERLRARARRDRGGARGVPVAAGRRAVAAPGATGGPPGSAKAHRARRGELDRVAPAARRRRSRHARRGAATRTARTHGRAEQGCTLGARERRIDRSRRARQRLAQNLAQHLRVLRVIASTEYKLKYADSALGYVWSIAKPLAMFAVLYTVFGRFFKLNVGFEHYPLYLLIGIVLWNFFVDATNLAMPSLVARASLLRKLAFPHLVIPLSVTLSVGDHVPRQPGGGRRLRRPERPRAERSWLWLPLLLVELASSRSQSAWCSRLHSCGCATSHQLWELTVQLLFFASPIIYPVGFLPPGRSRSRSSARSCR